MIDTSIFSELMRGNTRARERAGTLAREDHVAICPIVRGEILHGIERLPAGNRRHRLELAATIWFDRITCYPIPENAGDQYARAKFSCERRGLCLDENDLWIASAALALGAQLVTRDTDFGRIEGLKTVNWLVPMENE